MSGPLRGALLRIGLPSALAVALACGFGGPPPPTDEHDEHDEHGDAHEATPGQLVIDADARRDLRITTATARSGAADEHTTLLGELAVDEDLYAEVGSPLIARVRSLPASSGDVVTAGAPLVEVEAADLGQTRADLLGARAQADRSRDALERKRSLTGGMVSSAELKAAEADSRSDEADVSAAEARLAAYGAGGSPSGGSTLILRSPIGGVVLSRDARIGEVVDPDHTLFRIADTSNLWLVAHAFERDALRITAGVEAEVTFAALPNRSFRGTVSLVGTEVDVGSRTLPIRLDVANPDGRLRPGMSATARLPLASEGDAVAVPSSALQRLEEGWVVFVPLDEGRFEIREVGRGRDLGGEVEIVSGLTGGEAVVVDGAFLLKAEAEKQAGGGDEHEH